MSRPPSSVPCHAGGVVGCHGLHAAHGGEVLPAVTEENLADHVDIFCEDGYFGLEETRLLLEQARLRGLLAKVHVNQFTAGGGVALCVEMGALSVDHLEVLEAQDVAELASSETMPVALPLCSLFLDLPYTPGRTLVDAGCGLAIATDFNPGSLRRATCIWRRLWAVSGWGSNRRSPRGGDRQWRGGLGAVRQVGGLAVGQEASLIVTRPLRSLDQALYAFGDPLRTGSWLAATGSPGPSYLVVLTKHPRKGRVEAVMKNLKFSVCWLSLIVWTGVSLVRARRSRTTVCRLDWRGTISATASVAFLDGDLDVYVGVGWPPIRCTVGAMRNSSLLRPGGGWWFHHGVAFTTTTTMGTLTVQLQHGRCQSLLAQ